MFGQRWMAGAARRRRGRQISLGIAVAGGFVAAIGLLRPLEQPVSASVTIGSSVGIRAADFNMYGVNNDRGMVNFSTENLSGQLAHQRMREAGIGWVRYWLSWESVEGSNGNYDWSRPDYDISAAISQGLSVYITVQAAPAWVHGGKTTYGWGRCASLTPGLEHTFDAGRPFCGAATYASFDPGNATGPSLGQSFFWKRFITEAVKRYGDRVKYWGFWNEGGDQWFYPEYAEAPCNNRYAQLLQKVIRPGRDAALAANPSLQIVGPEDNEGSLLNWLLSAERNGYSSGGCVIPAGRIFDVISFHAYNNQVDQYPVFDTIKSILDNYDRREVWVTEFPGQGGRIDSVLPHFTNRGWISKIFAYVMRNPDPNPGGSSCYGFGLIDYAMNPCYSYNQFKNYIAVNQPAMRFAGLSAEAGHDDYILLQNPHATMTTASVTFGNAAGQQIVRTVTLGANTRANVHVGANGWGGVPQGATITTTNPILPVWAEHSDYWGVSRQAGRASQGSSERSDTWYFAEGTTASIWVEHVSAYNPSPTDNVTVTWTYVNETTGPVPYSVVVPPRAAVRVPTASIAGVQASHSTIVSGKWTSGTFVGQPAPIVAERSISWNNDVEGHGARGVAFASTNWYFAEGAGGSWLTYLTVLNPTTRTATIRARYMVDGSGFTGWTSYTIGGLRRISFSAPGSGVYGIEIRSDNVPVVAERAMYLGANWTIGTAGEGTSVTSQRWLFPEGSTEGGFFSPFYLLANPSSLPAPVTVTFRGTAGVLLVYNTTVPSGGRVTIDPYSFPQLIEKAFATEVVVNSPALNVSPPGIVAERAMYWPRSGWYSGHVAMGMP